MALPKIALPEYTIQLFSQKKPVKFRPYLVGEEKLLMMAMTGEDPKEVDAAVRQLVRDCTFGTVDAFTLPSFDLEYMFLQLRARSVNNIIDNKYKCLNEVPVPANTTGQDGTAECGNLIQVVINLDDIKLTVPNGHTDKVWLTDDLGVLMQYPTAAVTEVTELSTLLPLCIKSVFTKAGDVYEVADQSKEEIDTFVAGLTIPMVEKINVFFETMPRLEYTFEFGCSKCGYKETVTLRGLMDFFG